MLVHTVDSIARDASVFGESHHRQGFRTAGRKDTERGGRRDHCLRILSIALPLANSSTSLSR